EVILVCHSMGGLIARQYIMEEIRRLKGNPELLDKMLVKRVLLFATPNLGADLARLGRHISNRQEQIPQLVPNCEFLENLNSSSADRSGPHA
ncbi:MAG: hypothetical protein GY835_10065, partial [bacterium]|nr:hypothetical protein [bacterium]